MASTTPIRLSRARREATPRAENSPPPLPPQSRLADLVAVSGDGRVTVRIADMAPMAAQVLGQVTTEQLLAAHAQGHQVLVVMPAGEPTRSVIIGVVADVAQNVRPPATARVDGRRVELTGHDEVVLTCGKASITLTKSGKVIIKGTYVSSGSVGVNRITGGSVQIN